MKTKTTMNRTKIVLKKKTAEIYRNRVLIGSAIFLLIRAKAVKTGKKEIFCNNTMFKGIVFFFYFGYYPQLCILYPGLILFNMYRP